MPKRRQRRKWSDDEKRMFVLGFGGSKPLRGSINGDLSFETKRKNGGSDLVIMSTVSGAS